MTVDELIEAIKKSYDERIRGSKYSGSASLRVIETIAAKTGLTMSMVLLKHLDKQYPDGEIPEADLRTIVADSLEHNYSLIAEETRRAQQKILEEAEVGIKPVVPEFDRDRAEGIAKNLSETGNREAFKKNVQNHSQNIVDESIKQNARVHQSLGLEPRVTRIYDGVGVHNRKDPCAWCKARAGTNMPYSEAYAKGSFERHPGCGCEILYKVGKRIQRQSDWTRNEWEDVNNTQYLQVEQRPNDITYSGYPESWPKLEKNAQIVDVNPNNYSDNCVNCAIAYEIRCRDDARDVIAREGIFELQHNPFGGWIDPEIIPIDSEDNDKSIRTIMSLWGDGSRAQLAFLYNYSPMDGHSIVAVQRNGAAFFIDIQEGTLYNDDEIRDLLNKDAMNIEICRIDKIEISDLGLSACEGRR